jgi:hypothetical protein
MAIDLMWWPTGGLCSWNRANTRQQNPTRQPRRPHPSIVVDDAGGGDAPSEPILNGEISDCRLLIAD